jgi:DNA invertase Pin-like site-specific DNA recombinase
MNKRAAIYVRVSTEQTIENQLRELHRIAERSGREIVHEYGEAGIKRGQGADARGVDLAQPAFRIRYFGGTPG